MLAAIAPAAGELRNAPTPQAQAVNQLVVSGNACGPAALMNAFRFGNRDWQRALEVLGGGDDKRQLLTMIREIGMRPSKNLPGRPRWSRRGIGLADLRDVANEMTLGKFLPWLREDVWVAGPRESPEALLRRVHGRLETSLAKGLPPVLSLRRDAVRRQGTADWRVVDTHCVTIVALPRRLPKGAREFHVAYVDPWGGKRRDGRIRVVVGNERGPRLEADFPHSEVGRQRVRGDETSMLIPAAALGRW